VIKDLCFFLVRMKMSFVVEMLLVMWCLHGC
jgi:hypothetical protein